MRIPMMSCKETAQVLQEARDRQLSLSERIRLRIHLFVCGPCQNFRKHMKFLDRAGGCAPDRMQDAGTGLSVEARDRIRRKLSR